MQVRFNSLQKQRIVQAISLAEKNTSGEIRVHVESHCSGDPLERAAVVFHRLKMDHTQQHNAVLVYVATISRKVAVAGDSGINGLVGNDFWKDVVEVLQRHFASEEYEEGLTLAVSMIGEKLKQFFPYQKNDVDELPNDISFGE